MPIELKVSIPNLSTIKAVFDSAPEKMTLYIAEAIHKTISKIESNVKKEAPVNKQSGGGTLRQSIRSQMLGIASGMVEAGAPYAGFVEGGTKPHLIQAKNARVLARRTGGTKAGGQYAIFGKTVKHPGTKENPFFQRGIDRSTGDIEKYFSAVLKKVFA